MPKREYVLALICYLAIPAVVICGAGVFQHAASRRNSGAPAPM